MSLRTRLALLTSVLVVGAVAFTGAAGWVSTRAELNDEIDDRLEDRAQLVVPRIADAGGRPGRGLTPLPDGLLDDGDVLQVLDGKGDPKQNIGGRLPVDRRDRELAEKGGEPRVRNTRVDGRPARMITSPLPGSAPNRRGAVQIASITVGTERALEGLLRRLLAVGGGLTVLAAGAGWFVARSTTGPLRTLTSAAESVTKTGDLSTSIPVTGEDEVGRLASSFRSMLHALEESNEQQRRLIQDAAHEVRTPLTTLRANIELLERAPDIGEPHRGELLGSLRREFEALTVLFNEVVELATGERDEAPFEPVDLDDPAERAARVFTGRTGRQLVATWEGGVVRGNVELLERAIGNLLSNADKYSPAGEPVDLIVRGGTVLVRDRGDGIAPEDHERIFDRFWRADDARALAGSGLGLAIVKQIVERHGGRVLVRAAPGGGAEVGFELAPLETPR